MTPRGIEVVEIGQTATYARTVTEADVDLFAELSGDDHPQHVDEAYSRGTRFGERIAHGALLVAYISASSTRWVRRWLTGRTSQSTVSYGYDRIRFIRPVRFGDTVEVTHVVDEIDVDADRFVAAVTVTNQDRIVVAAARHVMKFV